jgi:hypothetical protein
MTTWTDQNTIETGWAEEDDISVPFDVSSPFDLKISFDGKIFYNEADQIETAWAEE